MFDIPSMLSQTVLIAITIAFPLLYTIYGAIWRLYLSPVAHIPGPRFAALTFWNEFYYDVILDGKYVFKIRDYHEKYGPVIRINPYEVHINDPEFQDTLYVLGSKAKTDKWEWAMRLFGQRNVSAFDTISHDHHRLRRTPWNPFFSKASISRLQPLLIQGAVDKLCDRFAEYQAAGKPACVTHAYACLTADVISEYSFPEGFNLLDREGEDFDRQQYDKYVAISSRSHISKQIPWLYAFLDSMPQWLTKTTSPPFHIALKENNHLLEQAHILAEQKQTPNETKETTLRPSLLRYLFETDLLPESEKQPARIKGEAQVAMGAGTLTTMHALETATFHILSNRQIHLRLMAELTEKIPDPSSPPDLRQLESITYLMAIMHETFRLFDGVSHRLARIFPERTLTYTPSLLASPHHDAEKEAKSVTIPSGVPVSMTSKYTHDNATIFPSPYKFDPDRWLPLETSGHKLQKYLNPFGKGSRVCAGMELGKAEFLTTLANVWRRYGDQMELHDTIRERDVDTDRDWFTPVAKPDSKGIYVIFRNDSVKA